MNGGTAIPGCGVLPPLRKKPAANKKAKTRSSAPAQRRHAGRFETLNTFVDVSMRELTGTAAKLWFVLFRDTKPNGMVRVGMSDLARRCGVSVRSVRTAKMALMRLGLVELISTGTPSGGVSVYRVRGLIAERNFRSPEEKGRSNLRKQASPFPEWDQNGRPDPDGPDAPQENSRRQCKGAAR